LIAGGSAGGAVTLWRADTGGKVRMIETHRPADSLTFAPEGGALWSFGGGSMARWSLPGRLDSYVFRPVTVAAFSQDGRLGLTAAPGRPQGLIRDLRLGGVQAALYTRSAMVAAAFLANRIAIATADGGIQIWGAKYYEHVVTLHGEPGIRSVVFAADGDRLLGVYEQEVRVWHAPAAQPTPAAQSRPYADVDDVARPAWGIGKEMLAAGVFLLILTAVLCAVLFRKLWRPALDRVLEAIPALPVPRGVARAGRWTALIFGSLAALLTVFIMIAEGMPMPWSGDVRYLLGFVGMWVMAGGLVLAWFQQGVGGMLVLVGYGLLLWIYPVARGKWFLATIASLGLLHVLCWLRLRAGKPEGSA